MDTCEDRDVDLLSAVPPEGVDPPLLNLPFILPFLGGHTPDCLRWGPGSVEVGVGVIFTCVNVSVYARERATSLRDSLCTDV